MKKQMLFILLTVGCAMNNISAVKEDDKSLEKIEVALKALLARRGEDFVYDEKKFDEALEALEEFSHYMKSFSENRKLDEKLESYKGAILG